MTVRPTPVSNYTKTHLFENHCLIEQSFFNIVPDWDFVLLSRKPHKLPYLLADEGRSFDVMIPKAGVVRGLFNICRVYHATLIRLRVQPTIPRTALHGHMPLDSHEPFTRPSSLHACIGQRH